MVNNLQWLKSIKVVTLDWGDTLAHVGGKDQKLYDIRSLYDANLKYNLGISTDKIIEIVESLWSKYSECYNHEKVNWIDCNKTEILAPIIKNICKLPEDKILEICHLVEMQTENILPFYNNLPDILSRFKKLNWKIGLLSHVCCTEHIVKRVFEKNQLLKYFDFFSLSGDIKKVKPHPAHFLDAMNKSGFESKNILHIGDHPIKDSQGANEAGFYNALIVEPHLYDINQIRQAPANLFITSIFEMNSVLDEFEKNPESTFYSRYPC